MKQQLLDYIKQHGDVAPKALLDKFNVSRQLIHRYLKQLLEEGEIRKIGKSPLVFYQIKPNFTITTELSMAQEPDAYAALNDFIEITSDGRLLHEIEAFTHWCQVRKQPVLKTYTEYVKTLEKYAQYKKNNVIEGTVKLKGTKGFQEIHLRKLFYIDFYAIERFGKTTLGKLIHFGKQSQNKKLMNLIIERCISPVHKLCEQLNIEAVGYIPPTIKRDLQIMDVLKKGFNLSLPHLEIIKVKGEIVVPQKALSKIEDRINNTLQSIVVIEKRKYNNILLIDDAVGSGATLNETAGKLIRQGIAKTVYGLAITGSYKGFEVISEA